MLIKEKTDQINDQPIIDMNKVKWDKTSAITCLATCLKCLREKD